MHILHIFNSDSGGGIGGTISFIKESIRRNDHLTHFIVVPNSGNVKFINYFNEDEIALITIIYVPMHWWNKKKSSLLVKDIYDEIRGQISTVFHTKSVKLLQNIIYKNKIDLVYTTTVCIKSGAIAAKNLKIPHIWHIKEKIGKEQFMQFYMSDKNLVSFIDKNSSQIIAMSKFVADIFLKNSKQINKVNVIHDGFNYDPSLNSINTLKISQFRNSIGVEDNEILIANIGSLGSIVKRHDIFINSAIDILKTHSNIKFVIFGSIPKKSKWFSKISYEKLIKYKKIINDNKISNKIIFAGHKNDIPLIMNSIDILAHSCDMEGFGRVIIEAMSAGKPVVCPDKGGTAEIVIDKITGYHFESGNHKSLTEKIKLIIDNNKSSSSLGTAGMLRFKDHFTLDLHYNNMIKIINKFKL